MYLEVLVANLVEPFNLHHATPACQWAPFVRNHVSAAISTHCNLQATDAIVMYFYDFGKNGSFSNFVL
jgi:hypothetical protein